MGGEGGGGGIPLPKAPGVPEIGNSEGHWVCVGREGLGRGGGGWGRGVLFVFPFPSTEPMSAG